jgi:Raf kinase inhibitor-like YbhB/YbcL family protein
MTTPTLIREDTMTTTNRPPLTFSFFPDVPTIELSSADIADGEMLSSAQVANIMGYDGSNFSPQLSWSGFPEGTKSFAITVHDPDAPTGSGFWHWLAVNIPVGVTSLPTGAGSADSTTLPSGVLQIRNDAGTWGYVGSAPPPGEPHRYVHTVHAVDVDHLDVDADSSAAVVGFNLRFHAIARGQIVPVFGS